MVTEGITGEEGQEGTYAAGEGMSDTVESLAPVGEWVDAIQEVIQHHASERPYTTLLVAGTVGYVLAAGIPPFLSRMALGVGGRLVMARLASTLLEGR